MITDIREIDYGREFKADVCVVGAGAAGLTLVSELARAGVSVCLVESGDFNLDGPTQLLYEVENVGLPRLPSFSRRLRFFGGTTNHWTGKCGRLDPLDMQPRDWTPHSGWPISRPDLDPYYDKAEQILDLGPTRDGLDIAGRFKVPLPTLDDKVARLHAWQMSPPTRFGEKYRHLTTAANVQVLLNANAVNVQTNTAADHVEHIDIRSLSGKSAKVRALVYAIACGGIENARLLLASRSVNPRGVGNAHDVVGRYFMEHIRSRQLIAMDRDPYVIQKTYNEFSERGQTYLLGLSLTEQFQRSEKILNAAFHTNYDSIEDSATETASQLARELLGGNVPENFHASMKRVMENFDEVLINARRKVYAPGQRRLTRDASVLVVETEQSPNPDSRISLSDKTDALGQPMAKVDWRFTELDRTTMLTAINAFAAQLWLHHRVRIRLPEAIDNPLEYWGYNFFDVSHHIGTTRMSSDPKRGVVDADCCVHGVNNLFMAGSSVFPTSGQVNPTMTIVALAVRLADKLALLVKNGSRRT